MDINQYQIQNVYNQLDENNRQMVDRLREVYPVEFRIWQLNRYSVILKTIDVQTPQIVVFFYMPLSQEKIAHELLHMFCQLSLGTNACILSSPEEDGIYKKIFTESFCEQLLNNTEHIIIYPEYKDMGYAPNLFFEPFSDPSSKIAEFKKYGIKNHGSKFSLTMVVNYLALCIHLHSYPIDNSCQKYLKDIRNIEYPLFSAVSQFFKGLDDIEISAENYEYMQEKYMQLRTSIVSWIDRNMYRIVHDLA